MIIGAIALYIIFLALAFGLRTLIQLRRTGSTGFRAFSAERSAAERAGVLLVTLGGVLSFAGLAASSALPEFAPLDRAAIAWVGAALAAAAIALVTAAQFNMGDSWRIGVDTSERTDLVTTGLFAVVRNPIFTGMLAFWIGIALMVPNALTILGFFVALAGIEVQVRMVEEPYLLRVHGVRYRDYASRTGRLLPGLGRLGAAARTGG
jgi:protein-S-isoprenylcysteine O-methyltransferase Ste14